MMLPVDEETWIETSTQEDVDYVESNFREGDRLEHESLDGGRTRVTMFEECWTVKHKGEIIGYCGVIWPGDETFMSPTRFLCYMSCVNADRYKLAYVKRSRAVMREVVRMTPERVTRFLSLPAKAYAGSVRWHARVLKMRPVREVKYKGVDFILFETTRKEVMK